MSARRRASGMTLIELMVAMAIVAILAAIAYPSYQRHVARTQRTAAAACLSQFANYMERYYTTRLNYQGATQSPACANEGDIARFYSIPAATIGADNRSYTIRAVPTDTQQAKDPAQCGELTLNQAGARTPDRNECW